MTSPQDEFLLQECEIKPNKKNFRTCHFVLVAILLVWIANEAGIFYVDLTHMRIGSIAALVSTLIPLFLCLQQNWAVRRYMKYVFLVSACVTTVAYAVTLSFHAVLIMTFPYVVALHYKDVTIGKITIAATCFIGAVSPVISYVLGMWDYRYLRWLLAFSNSYVSAGGALEPGYPAVSAGNIFLMQSFPNMIVLFGIGSAVLRAIQENRESVIERFDTLEKEKRIESMQENMLTNMAIVIEDRGGGTGAHVYNVKAYVKLIVEYILDNHIYPDIVTREYATMLTNASVIHDVGKVGVPDEILHITGKYTPEQYKIMQSHAIKGEQIVLNTFGKNMKPEEVQLLRDIAGTHHERWDGNGYPRGLRGEAIPLAGRIMAVADVFDALISMRVYKETMTVDQAFDVLVQDSGTHFDKSIVAIFLALRPQVEEIVEKSRRAEQTL